MPGFVVDITTTMTCPHGGKVTFIPAGPPAVLVNGQPVMTAADQITVVGCGLAAVPNPPCVTVKWANLAVALAGNVPDAVAGATRPTRPWQRNVCRIGDAATAGPDGDDASGDRDVTT